MTFRRTRTNLRIGSIAGVALSTKKATKIIAMLLEKVSTMPSSFISTRGSRLPRRGSCG